MWMWYQMEMNPRFYGRKGEIKMYIMNFLAFILCVMCAIWHGVNGNIAWLLVECGLAIANLPFAIKWIKEFMNNCK